MFKIHIYCLIAFTLFVKCSKNIEKQQIECDCETVTSDMFLSKNSGYRFYDEAFHNLDTRTDEYSRSGKYAVKIDSTKPYSLTYTINKVKAKEHFRVSCWRYTKSCANSSIIASANEMDVFYSAQRTSIKESQSDWEQLVMDIIIPNKADNHDLKIYLYTKDSIAIFDDLKIEYLSRNVKGSPNQTSSFTDSRDGNIYRTVKIGDDWWMAENLKFSNCTNCCFYENNECLYNEYGMLYSYFDAINIAPHGWRLPSDDDWMRLEENIGISSVDVVKYGNRGTNNSYILNEFGTSGFDSKKSGAYSNGFYNLERAAYYWTSSEIDSAHAYCREINHWANIGKFKDDKSMRFSVRCIKQ